MGEQSEAEKGKEILDRMMKETSVTLSNGDWLGVFTAIVMATRGASDPKTQSSWKAIQDTMMKQFDHCVFCDSGIKHD